MKKVCFVTSSRADYGLLKPLMTRFKKADNVKLQVVVTGTHLSKKHGYTLNEIISDGIPVDECVDIISSTDTVHDICRSSGQAISGVSKSFEKLDPDIVVLLGDRYEILSAATAATIHRIPIAHLHGGELTEGAMDEVFRHSITKMSHLHFTSTEDYRNRVIQLGEQPDCVWNTGAIGVENVLNVQVLTKDELFDELDIPKNKDIFLITFHPETLGGQSPLTQVSELAEALMRFSDVYFLFTKANADTEGNVINDYLEKLASQVPERMRIVSSLGYLRYLNLIRYASVVIGNSSSGILEVPSFHVPTVNIGDRQKGRLRSKSVIDAQCEADDIEKAIVKALSPSFRVFCEKQDNPYEGEGTSDVIFNHIMSALNAGIPIQKKFYDFK